MSADSPWAEGAQVELADFGPEGHLLSTCLPRFDGYECHGNGQPQSAFADCAALLYAIAQDAEAALARIEALCQRWDALTHGESVDTRQIRAAVRGSV